MRASRLLSIQMLLQAHGRMSAPALAAALEVSVRTLYRDVDELSAAGVPIYAERGRHGGFALMAGWQTTLTGLTPSEAQAVFLSGLAGPAAQLGLGADVQAARLKLTAALPPGWRDDAQRISTRLHLDPVDWYREADPVPHLHVVAQAVWAGQALSMRYESWRGTAQRSVGPLGLVLKAGTWYLVALLAEAPRTFRVASIQAAALLPAQRVRRPRGFDLAAYWHASLQRFERALHTAQAAVLATPEGLRGLRHQGAAIARAVDAALAAAPTARREDGRLRLRIPIESVAHATGPLMRLAPEVEVIEPPELRSAIVERLGQAMQRYAAGPV